MHAAVGIPLLWEIFDSHVINIEDTNSKWILFVKLKSHAQYVCNLL